MMIERRFVLSNRLGLHARTATRFVQTAARFAADVEVETDGQRADGKAIVPMLELVARQGTTLIVRGRGEDADQAVSALGELIEARFGDPC
jgi:phosphocarrier protein HPr